MSNASQRVLTKRFTKVTGYGEDAIHHKAKNGASVGKSFKVLDGRERSECDQRGGTA